MATAVMKSFGTLQLELEEAKTNLKDVDEHIKKLIGRDPSQTQIRPGLKRPGTHVEESRGRPRGQNNPNFTANRNKQTYENDEPKKRNVDSSVFKRLSERTRHNDDDISEIIGKNHLISKIIVTPKEIPSRQDVLAAQGADERSKARNKRMFGSLLGTLQKFRQEETKLKQKEEKRAIVEKKLEDQQIKERENMKKERQDLFFNRKRKQAEIRMIELKMTRMKEHADWEEKQRPLMNFIQTKAKPHIYFLPKILNEHNKTLLENCRQNMEKMIDRKRQDVYEELNTIEQRMKRNFSNRQQGVQDGDKPVEEEEEAEEEEEDDDEEVTADIIEQIIGGHDVDMEADVAVVIIKSDKIEDVTAVPEVQMEETKEVEVPKEIETEVVVKSEQIQVEVLTVKSEINIKIESSQEVSAS